MNEKKLILAEKSNRHHRRTMEIMQKKSCLRREKTSWGHNFFFFFFFFFLRTQFCKLLRKINIIHQELLLYLLPSHPCLKWAVSLTLYPRPYTLDPKRLISFKLSFLYRKTYHIGQSREKCNFISKCGRRAKRCSGGRIWNKEREYFAPLNVDHFNSSVLFYCHAQLSRSHLNF